MRLNKPLYLKYICLTLRFSEWIYIQIGMGNNRIVGVISFKGMVYPNSKIII